MCECETRDLVLPCPPSLSLHSLTHVSHPPSSFPFSTASLSHSLLPFLTPASSLASIISLPPPSLRLSLSLPSSHLENSAAAALKPTTNQQGAAVQGDETGHHSSSHTHTHTHSAVRPTIHYYGATDLLHSHTVEGRAASKYSSSPSRSLLRCVFSLALLKTEGHNNVL